MPIAITDSMRRAIDETDRRRSVQRSYNLEHGITPQSITSQVDMGLAQILKAEYGDVEEEETAGLPEFASQADLDAYIVTAWKPRCATPPRNSSSRKPPACATRSRN